jgi:Tfp pilus assembly PilM family ATPase
MKTFDFMRTADIFIEISPELIRASGEIGSIEFPLERQPNGRLTAASSENLTARLRSFVDGKPWQARPRALCAIGARGVSLRRISLPPAPKEDYRQLLRMQIEAEFPLPPDQLAWGWAPLEGSQGRAADSQARQGFVVAAVRRETVEEYSDIISRSGANPIFTLAALSRIEAGPHPPGAYGILDIGRNQSELVSVEDGSPSAVRVIPWGEAQIARMIAQHLGIGMEEAEGLKPGVNPDFPVDDERRQKIHDAIASALDSLGAAIVRSWSGQRLYLTGAGARGADFAQDVAARLGGASCESMDPLDSSLPAAIRGLVKLNAEGRSPALTFQFEGGNGRAGAVRPEPYKWVALAAALAACLLLLPLAEAFLMKPVLTRRLAAIHSNQPRLAMIDRELGFFRYLKDAQPPYIESISVIANALPTGTRLDSLSMNRRGEVSMRGNIRTADQVSEFRSKLIGSGFFSTVSVEEQTPTPDRQQLNVRMSAQWKPAGERDSAAIDPPLREPEKPKGSMKQTNSSPVQGKAQ